LSGRIESALEKVDKLISENADSIGRTVRNVEAFSKAVDADKVRSLVTNAEGLAKQLNESAGKFDKLMVTLDGVLGSGENSTATEITEAARSFRKLADNIDARTKEISAGVTKFTGSGLRQYEALASDARRTLDDVNKTLRSFDKNPQQLLFGKKPPIPEYSGR